MANKDFWSWLAKSSQSQKVSVTWTEKNRSKTRFNARPWKEELGNGNAVHPEVQNTNWEFWGIACRHWTDCVGPWRTSMESIVNRGRGYEERYADLKESRVRECRRSTNDSLPPQFKSSATLSREHRVRMLVHNAQRLHRTTQFIMQEYLNLVDWKGLELLYTERRCKASVKRFECFPTCWAGCGQSG